MPYAIRVAFKAAEALLREEGWNSPEPERYPTGGELVAQYLEPLATRTRLSQHVQTSARVVSVAASPIAHRLDLVEPGARHRFQAKAEGVRRRGQSDRSATDDCDCLLRARHSFRPTGDIEIRGKFF
jgi:hypothetical protein